jgi:hypothetical protein
MARILVYRLRNLDRELAEMLMEADGRCAVQYALQLDEIREHLSTPLEAAANNEARILRRYADKDKQGHFVANEKNGGLKFSSAEQQEQLEHELATLAKSEVELDLGALPKLRKADLAANGLAASGSRIANLRPILDLSEPDAPDAPRVENERTIILAPQPRGTPHA